MIIGYTMKETITSTQNAIRLATAASSTIKPTIRSKFVGICSMGIRLSIKTIDYVGNTKPGLWMLT